ncbi:hypothetical protein [Hymenobacter sp. APR13]|uniref:hypothetical protein n=1 Tax=Hymenobacter sp. APR13 TaxID=1356852 RepID=UPI0012E001CB|nr:hypothetical protein [Hymenobacter sp. APR13]
MSWQTTPRRVRRTPARPVAPLPIATDSGATPQPLLPVINFDKPTFPDSPRIVGPGY